MAAEGGRQKMPICRKRIKFSKTKSLSSHAEEWTAISVVRGTILVSAGKVIFARAKKGQG